MKVPKIIIGITLVLLYFCFTMAMGGIDTAFGAEDTVTIGILNPMSGRVSRLEPYSIGAV
nr:hypothetical protein [Desulfobacterales bacterium]